MNGIIYCYTSPSGKQYVGQTIHEAVRKRQHELMLGGSRAFYNAIKKYGFHSFKYEVIHTGIGTIEELNRLETMEITNRKSLSPLGYNLNMGGDSHVPSEETRQRRSAALKRRIITPEMRAKISKTLTGRPMPREQAERMSIQRMGHEVSQETRNKISAKNKGRKLSPEVCAKMAINNSKRVTTEETKEKLRISSTGFRHTNEVRTRMKTHNHKNAPVICIETGIVFVSISEANRFIGRGSVGAVTRGDAHTAGGYHWELVNG